MDTITLWNLFLKRQLILLEDDREDGFVIESSLRSRSNHN